VRENARAKKKKKKEDTLLKRTAHDYKEKKHLFGKDSWVTGRHKQVRESNSEVLNCRKDNLAQEAQICTQKKKRSFRQVR